MEITSGSKPREVREVSKGGRGKRGGVEQAARDLNVPATNLRQSVRIASLSDDAKEAAKARRLITRPGRLGQGSYGFAMNRTPLLPVGAVRKAGKSIGNFGGHYV